MSNFTYGCDPEFFAVYNKDGKLFAASPALINQDCGIKIIGGDKKHPVFLENSLYRWIMDGVAFELNFKKPFNNPIEMWRNINVALDSLNDFISHIKHPELGQLELFKKPTVNIDPGLYLPRMDNETIYQGFIFGCDSDEDAIISDYECKTVSVVNYLYRHGGGHDHFGNNYAHGFIMWFVRFLAITVGNYCMAETSFLEEEKIRVNTYGKAGRFRPQRYSKDSFGTEYRSPSNSWCSFPQEKIEEKYFWADKALEFLKEERIDILDEFLIPTANAISTADSNRCKQILSQLI